MKNFIESMERAFYQNPVEPGLKYKTGFNNAVRYAIDQYNELHPSTEIPESKKQAKEGSFKVRVTKSNYFYTVGDVYDNVTSINDCGVEKWKVVNERGWYVGNLNKSDCEIIPETTIIPFDYQRWKSGDYLRVVTKSGHEVKEIKEFDADILFNFCGVLDHKIHTWDSKGSYSAGFSSHDEDLHLEIATPPKKQVTTYHYVSSSGEMFASKIKSYIVKVLGETITEQQPDGTWKIISTTLK